MARQLPSIERVRELLAYDQTTGELTWRRSTNRRIRVGSVAGGRHEGYIVISVDGVSIYAHRIAWLLTHGKWPAGEVDHKNGNGTDNSIDNLREGPRKVNMQNIRKAKVTSKSGMLGVRQRNGSFKARIAIDGRDVLLGSFATADEAHAAYVLAKRQHHEGCTL